MHSPIASSEKNIRGKFLFTLEIWICTHTILPHTYLLIHLVGDKTLKWKQFSSEFWRHYKFPYGFQCCSSKVILSLHSARLFLSCQQVRILPFSTWFHISQWCALVQTYISRLKTRWSLKISLMVIERRLSMDLTWSWPAECRQTLRDKKCLARKP